MRFPWSHEPDLECPRCQGTDHLPPMPIFHTDTGGRTRLSYRVVVCANCRLEFFQKPNGRVWMVVTARKKPPEAPPAEAREIDERHRPHLVDPDMKGVW